MKTWSSRTVARRSSATAAGGPAEHAVLRLQRMIGNSATTAWLMRDPDDDKYNPGKPPDAFGQNRAVDPNDKGFGLGGTWDFNSPPKITGAYGDPPGANGDPLKSGDQGDTKSGDTRYGPHSPQTSVDGGTSTPQIDDPVPLPPVTWGTPEMYGRKDDEQ